MTRTMAEIAELEAQIQIHDPERWARILATRAHCVALRAAESEREAAKAMKYARLNAFLSTLPGLPAGRARVSLERSMRWNRSEIVTRFVMIERLIDAGATLDAQRLWKPEGSTYYGTDALTTYGLAYAAYLLEHAIAEPCLAPPASNVQA